MAEKEDKKGEAPEASDRPSLAHDSGTALAAGIVLATHPLQRLKAHKTTRMRDHNH